MPKTALFVIDIQHELARDPKTEIPHASRICDAGHLLLARARSAIDAKRGDGLPVDMSIVFVQHEENEANGTLVRGSSAWELIFQPRLGDGHEMLVAKSTG
jgi:hypothetical protein